MVLPLGMGRSRHKVPTVRTDAWARGRLEIDCPTYTDSSVCTPIILLYLNFGDQRVPSVKKVSRPARSPADMVILAHTDV